jgi:hypothetical protein
MLDMGEIQYPAIGSEHQARGASDGSSTEILRYAQNDRALRDFSRLPRPAAGVPPAIEA